MSLNESRARINLKDSSILVVEQGTAGIEIVVQILVGFGAKNITKCETLEDAKAHIGKHQFDLMIVNAALHGSQGYDLVHWLRREGPPPNRFAPLILLSSHTQASRVARGRDCGAHFFVAKPLTPLVVLERILWIAREQRPFVEVGKYVGPDRRFKFEGPPDGTAGRRSDDLHGNLGDAVAPNMSQNEIDALMQPRKVNM